jgi:hypothetical protein
MTAGWEAGMDRASALLAALRARAVLDGTGRLRADAVEALAGALGMVPEEVPAIVDRLQREGHVALVWGGSLEVLPGQTAAVGGGSGGPTFTFQGVTFGPGATIAGRDATGGAVKSTPEEAFGAVAAVLGQLRLLRPELEGEAAKVADEAEHALSEAVKPEATPEARRNWAGTASAALGRLFDLAPKAKALLDIGEKALGAIT